jgi:hypothetical protein
VFSPWLPQTDHTAPSAVSSCTSPTDQPAACRRARDSSGGGVAFHAAMRTRQGWDYKGAT